MLILTLERRNKSLKNTSIFRWKSWKNASQNIVFFDCVFQWILRGFGRGLGRDLGSILASPGSSWAPLADFLGFKNQVFFMEGSHVVPKRVSDAIWGGFWEDLRVIWEALGSLFGGFGRDLRSFGTGSRWKQIPKMNCILGICFHRFYGQRGIKYGPCWLFLRGFQNLPPNNKKNILWKSLFF